MSLLAQTSTQQLVTSSITAVTARFQTLSTLIFNVSSINGIVPGAAFNGSTLGLSSATVNTSSLQTLNINSLQGYISSLVVDSFLIGSNSGFIDMGDIITTSHSSIQINTGLFTASGAVCTPQIIVSTINGSNITQLVSQPLQSSIIGLTQNLGSAGYISTAQLFSTVQGIGSGFTGSTIGLSAATINVSSIRSINLSSVQGYISSFRTDSLTVGGTSGFVTIQDLITQTASTGELVAGSGFISSLQINSLSFGPSGYVIVRDVIANSLSTTRLNTQALYTNNAYIGNVSSQSAILFPGIDATYKATAVAEQTTGVGTQELLLYKVSSTTDQIRLQTTGNIVFEVGAPARSWPSTTQLATPSLYIAGSTSNVGIGTATPATTFDVIGTGRFQILSSLALNISSINGAAPGGTFDGSTISLSTGSVFTGNLLANNITMNSTITANIANFSPKSIHGLQMWMDAADRNAFTYSSGSTIRYWLDKSGNGYDASNYTNAFTSTTCVVLSGSGLYTHLNASGMAGNVFKEYGFIVFTSADSNSINVLSGNYYQNRDINVQNGSHIRIHNSGGEYIANIASPRWQLHTPQLISWSSGGYIGFNASTIVNSGSNFSSYMGAWGQRNTQFGNFSGTLREIVIYQGVTLSSNDIYAVEGYLAWKWGITPNMVSTHPYKNFNITTSTITTFDAFTTVTNNNNMRITTSKYLDRSSNIYPVTTPKFQVLGHLDSRVSIQEMQTLNTGVVLTLTSGLFGTFFRLPAAAGGYYFSFPLVYLAEDVGGYWDLFNTTNGAITINVSNGRGLGNFVLSPLDTCRITWSGTTHLLTYSSKWPSYLGQDITNSRLGINTGPAYTLDVAGNARFTSNVGVATTPTSYTFDVAGNARFTSNVGIGTIPLSGTNYLDVIGTSRFQVISSVAMNVSSINGGPPGGVPFTGSTISISSATIFVSSISMNTTLMSTMSMVDTTLISTTGNVTQQSNILYFNTMPFAGTQSWLGQMIIPPGPPLISIYPYTGSDQTWVVPTGVNSINAYMWAAGGGGVSSASGGAGAFIQAAVPVTPGETLTLIVGGGGGVASTVATFGGGGAGGGSGFGTQGGGRTAIKRGSIGSNDYVVVGAGGGGTSFSSAGGGGPGGIMIGSAAIGTTGLEGQGGTQSAGGAGTAGVISTGSSGSLGAGGAAGAGGGGGGAGYYGGGGSGTTSGVGASGGGGSSLVNNVVPILLATGSGGTAPNTNSQYYIAPVAAGGTSISGTGGNGLIVVSYTAAPPASPGGLTLTLNGTTATLSWTAAGASLYYWAFYGSSTSAYTGVYLMSGSTSGTSVSYSMSATLFDYFRLVSLSPLGCISQIVSSPIVNVPAPSGLTLTGSGATLTMSWSAVSGATAYTYTLYSNTAFAYGGSSVATASISGVTATYSSGSAGTYYYFTVSATTISGTSLLTTSSILQIVSEPTSTGGTTTTSGSTRYHIFTSTGTFALTSPSSLSVSALIIAGGGGGGNNHGGGGGAGEVCFTSTVISNISYSMVVGIGGSSSVNGSNSSAFSITANGGGRGGGEATGNATSGGSGGGGSGHVTSPTGGASFLTGGGLGNSGGNGFVGPGGGGGGGGAGTAGSNAPTGGSIPSFGAVGGNGTLNYSTIISAISSSMPTDWQTATSGGYIAAGGGGGNWGANPIRAGGLGGGGNGGTNDGNPVLLASNAINFTGSGGGGGGSFFQIGGSGGTGLVVVSYRVGESSPTNLTLTTTGGTANMSWTASPGATGYNWALYESLTNGYFGTVFGTGTTTSTTYTATATGLNLTKYYYFTVIATGTINSAAVTSAIVYALPSAPSNLSITISGLTVNMSWGSTAGAYYYTYTVFRVTSYAYSGTQVARAVNGTSTSATYTGIEGNYYYFTVSVTTSAGTSILSTSSIVQIAVPISITATGGALTTSTLYNTYRFTSTGTTSFTLTSPASVSSEVLIVAGGGGGGSVTGGGAGAGGVITSNVTFSSATYSVVVGVGGTGGSDFNAGTVGSNSSFNSLTAIGGGGGGGNGVPPLSGGSGGGGGWATSGAAGTSGQGFAGGSSATSPTNPASGGGGAGGVGGNAVNSTGAGGAGGIGQSYTVGGNVYTLGGGGGGGADTYRAESAPGGVAVNGGGNGGSGTVAPGVGTPNTGGGGGGGGNRGPISGANGGSGIVIIAISKILLSPTNPLLVSSGGSATMSWTASSGAQGYSWILYQSATNAYIGSSFATGTTTSATTATATGLNLNSYYYFTVAATASSASSAAVASAIVLQLITGPATATLTASGTTLSLSWDSVAGATSYTYTIYSNSVYSYTGMTVVTSASTASTSATYTGTAGTYYYFTVTATSSSGTSAPTTSGIVTAYTLIAISATGGTATTPSGYNVYTFTTVGSNTFTLTSPSSVYAQTLIVAGGGGGGAVTGGGGGAGGVISSNVTFSAATYSVLVGTGGTGGTGNNTGNAGSNSSFNSLIAIGGGGGGGQGSSYPPTSGGSGGGGGWGTTGAAGTSNQGFAGGNGASAPNYPGAGGGGAGGIGGNGVSGNAVGGAGGIGQSYTVGGNVYTLGGGGGGGADSFRVAGALGGAGVNGGGNGGTGSLAPVAGTSNTGGGGGGAADTGSFLAGASGGSGIVILAVPTFQVAPTSPTLSITTGTATLGWTASTGAAGYSWILYRSSTNAYNGTSNATGTTTSAVTATASGLSTGFFWYFTVAATSATLTSQVVASSIVAY